MKMIEDDEAQVDLEICQISPTENVYNNKHKWRKLVTQSAVSLKLSLLSLPGGIDPFTAMNSLSLSLIIFILLELTLSVVTITIQDGPQGFPPLPVVLFHTVPKLVCVINKIW